MKKIIFILSILMLNGCISTQTYREKTIHKIDECEARRFEYNGHYYIQFFGGDRTSVVHDPDCKCNKKFDW